MWSHLGCRRVGALLVLGGLVWWRLAPTHDAHAAALSLAASGAQTAPTPAVAQVVSLSPQQASTVPVGDVASREFSLQREAVGYIDFNQDKTVAVSPPWSGRITDVLVQANAPVKRGQTLFVIDSADLLQAQQTLLSTAAALKLSNDALDRARKLAASQAGAQKDLEQAIADQTSAQSAHSAARDALRMFGLSEAQMVQLLQRKQVNGHLPVTSPLDGIVTTRAAAVGSLVQAGTTPAPITVSDVRTVWMVAAVSEYDLPLLREGQRAAVTVAAYPGRVFAGAVGSIGASADPATHRIPVRCVIADPHHDLRAQMLATFVLDTGHASRQPAVPVTAVVRESDGVMVVFVTQDGRHFVRRPVTLDGEQGGFYPVTQGLRAGERVALDSALFLSNALALQQR